MRTLTIVEGIGKKDNIEKGANVTAPHQVGQCDGSLCVTRGSDER